MRYDMGVEAALLERMMGHVQGGVTQRHYERPDERQLATVVARAFRERPFVRQDGT